MESTEIEIEWMKELLKENEIEIWRIKRENKNQKDEIKRLKGALDYANRDREDMHNKIIELWNKRESQRNMNYKLRSENTKLKEELEWYKKQYKHTMWVD